jgi:NADH-quinone oxidoreductase subunit J
MPASLFYIHAPLTVLAGYVMITRRHPLTAAFSLVACFIGLAGLYAMLSAPLLAILQVLVYAGAIMALVVFVIMLLNVREDDLPAEPGIYWKTTLAMLVMTPVFVLLVTTIRRLPTSGLGPDVPANFGSIEEVGKLLFNTFGFPFELISLLLTVAVVGVVVLAKRKF